ncbi:MAG: hypothetical protein IPH41_12050 [Sulfuritalea sp.]|nr:hypothetical protein [Sulfuritalea sp.]
MLPMSPATRGKKDQGFLLQVSSASRSHPPDFHRWCQRARCSAKISASSLCRPLLSQALQAGRIERPCLRIVLTA